MEKFFLPHNHGAGASSASFYKTLRDKEKFAVSAELFKTLSDTTRIQIFWILCHREECVVNLSSMLNTTSPAISHHIRLLKEQGLILGHRDGKEVHYRVADTELCRLLHRSLEQVMNIACPQHSDRQGLSGRDTVHMVHDFLADNLSERITIEELAAKYHINPTTLKETFKSEYGTSLALHMKKHRMEKAAELMINTSKSLGQISREVGYKSQSRFVTAFKSLYNMSPTQFKKTQR